MKTTIGFLAIAFAGLLIGAPPALAASASAGASAACKDGSTWTGTSHRGACRGHQGVQSWSDSGAAATSTSTSTTTTSSSRGSRTKTSNSTSGSIFGGASMPVSNAPATTSSSASAICKDGTTWSGTSHRGACRGHQGVQSWSSASTTTSTNSMPRSPITPAPLPTSNTSTTSLTTGTVSAICKDGTPWSGTSRRGACRGHQGVQSWLSTSITTSPTSMPRGPMTPASMPANPPMHAPANNSPMGNSRNASTTRTGAPTMPTAPAAGGGPGRVWVNTSSKVYHCQNDRWYGKTKQGQYMTEAQALAQGYRADRGKGCS